jgi:formate hydrogenlyase transcriptional activator
MSTATESPSAPEMQELEDQLRFEMFLSDFAARLLSLPPDDTDAAIRESLGDVVVLLGGERSAIGQFGPDGRSLRWTHGFATTDARWPDLEGDIAQVFPWYIQQIREGRSLVLPRALEGFPPHARAERERIASTGVKSMLTVPLGTGGEVLGLMSLLAYSVFRDWTPTTVSRLKLLAGVYANALDRRRAARRLRRADDLNRSVLASVASEIAVLDGAGRLVVANESWTRSARRKGVPSDVLAPGSDYLAVAEEAMSRGQIEGRESLERLRAVVSGREVSYQGTYRYVSPDGHHRHYLLTAARCNGAAGAVLVHTDVTELEKAKAALERSLWEASELRARVEAENVVLRQQVRQKEGCEEIVGTSPPLRRVLAQVDQVAATDTPVLLLGETGTGKDLIAHTLHDRSRRRRRTLVTVNCAALPPTLVESELFGYEKGAFTGALQRHIGRFEVADGGTLFLDEIGELPPEVQVKLLRVVQTGEFERLGSTKTIRVDVRLIAATNRDLEKEVRAGRFRADLFYRLGVFPITLPPLRERTEDIPLLVWHLIARRQAGLGRSIKRVPERLMQALAAYSWPGNVRELQNVVERALIMTSGSTLAADPAFLQATPAPAPVPQAATLVEIQRAHIRSVLNECGWRIAGKGNAADRLGLKRSTLQSRMKKLGLERPAPGA